MSRALSQCDVGLPSLDIRLREDADRIDRGPGCGVVTTGSEQISRRHHPLLVALFVVHLILLAWIILWKLDTPWVGAAAGLPRPLKLIPYVPSGDFDASAPGEVLANVALFIPFGVYLKLLAPRWRWWALTGVFVGASLLLETAQHLLSTGSFDTTDVIDNTLGGLAGVGLVALARRLFREQADRILTRICLIAGIVAVVAVGAFVVSP